MTRVMTEEQKEHRRQVQHDRYMRKRVEIRAYQKNYYETHKPELKAKRQQREFEKRYLRKPKLKRDRKEIDQEYYMAHREKILARSKQRNYERRKQQQQNTIAI